MSVESSTCTGDIPPECGAGARRCNFHPDHPVAEATVRRYVQRRKQELELGVREVVVPQSHDMGRGLRETECRSPCSWYQTCTNGAR